MGCVRYCPLIWKVFALIFFFIILVLGYHAHFGSSWTTWAGSEEGQFICKNSTDPSQEYNKLNDSFTRKNSTKNPKCPKDAIPMEIGFLVLTMIFLLTSIGMIGLGIYMGPEIRVWDSAYHGFVGVLVMTAGFLIFVAATRIDSFERMGIDVIEYVKMFGHDKLVEARDNSKFFIKRAVFYLAIADAFLYITACVLICRIKQ